MELKEAEGKKSSGEAYVRCSSKASEKYQSNTDQR